MTSNAEYGPTDTNAVCDATKEQVSVRDERFYFSDGSCTIQVENVLFNVRLLLLHLVRFIDRLRHPISIGPQIHFITRRLPL